MSKEMFIIDFGGDLLAEKSNGQPPVLIARYSVWSQVGGKDTVIFSASTIGELAGFGDIPIVRLTVPGACTGQGK